VKNGKKKIKKIKKISKKKANDAIGGWKSLVEAQDEYVDWFLNA
jgi:hypothetical protein